MNTAKLHKKERKAKNIFPFHSFLCIFGFAEVGWHSGKCKFICFSSRFKKALWLRRSCFALGKMQIHLLFLSFQKGTLAAPKLLCTRENANSFAFPLVFV